MALHQRQLYTHLGARIVCFHMLVGGKTHPKYYTYMFKDQKKEKEKEIDLFFWITNAKKKKKMGHKYLLSLHLSEEILKSFPVSTERDLELFQTEKGIKQQ